jgi:hypothetical protein
MAGDWVISQRQLSERAQVCWSPHDRHSVSWHALVVVFQLQPGSAVQLPESRYVQTRCRQPVVMVEPYMVVTVQRVSSWQGVRVGYEHSRTAQVRVDDVHWHRFAVSATHVASDV